LLKKPSTFRFFDIFDGILSVSPIALQAYGRFGFKLNPLSSKYSTSITPVSAFASSSSSSFFFSS